MRLYIRWTPLKVALFTMIVGFIVLFLGYLLMEAGGPP